MIEAGVGVNEKNGSMYVPHRDPELIPAYPKPKDHVKPNAVKQFLKVDPPEGMKNRARYILDYIKANFPESFYDNVVSKANRLTLWTRRSMEGFVSAWGIEFNEKGGSSLGKIERLLQDVCVQDSYVPVLSSDVEIVLKYDRVELFASLGEGEFTIPHFKADGTYSFVFIFQVVEKIVEKKESLEGMKRTSDVCKYCSTLFVDYQMAQYNGVGPVPKPISRANVMELLEQKNSNAKVTWRDEARCLLDEFGFMIICGVHAHGGGGTKAKKWITIRPPVGETAWHLQVIAVNSTKSSQNPVNINGTRYMLQGCTYGVSYGGENISTFLNEFGDMKKEEA